MADDQADPCGAGALQRVLGELGELNQSPVGRVIFDQLSRVVQEHSEVHERVDQAYSLLLHVLLDTYAREPDAEHVTRINARLIELRQASSGAARTLSRQLASVARAPAAGAAVPASDPSTAPAPEPVPESSPSMANDTGSVQAVAEEAKSEENCGEQAERRVESVYRMHLDRKRGEIEKLQESLARNVTDTITQNREFGALLEIELRALQQADGAQEVETLRSILIGGIEELIQGQRQLDTKLNRTAGYLELVRNDSDRLREELHKVRLLSLTDEFTGLPNRRAFMRRLQDEIGRAQRYGSSLALALLDLDSFKEVNDTYGHAAGDEILRCYSNDVLSILRHHDLASRYGGEEFAILLPNTTREGALAALNKVRNHARTVRCMHEGRGLPLPTFSAGVTLYNGRELHTAFIDRADRALYRAKHLGRNRIEFELADPLTDSDGTEAKSTA